MNKQAKPCRCAVCGSKALGAEMIDCAKSRCIFGNVFMPIKTWNALNALIRAARKQAKYSDWGSDEGIDVTERAIRRLDKVIGRKK